MNQPESIIDFYRRTFQKETTCDLLCKPGIGHVNVFSRDACAQVSPYSRRDYFKISLIIGTGTLHYADRFIEINQPALLFSNPLVPYSWEAKSVEQDGWFCLFSKEFIDGNSIGFNIQETPFFKVGGEPVFFLNELQVNIVDDIFRKMKQEIDNDYAHKFDVVRNYLQLLIHEAMKIAPPQTFEAHKSSSQRVSSLFIELLERQFPVDPENSLRLKTAADFAKNMNVHVNSLNRALKEITGKTTTNLIGNRIIQEAKSLLLYTELNINEIAYLLGFEEPAYFNNFYKKYTRITPKETRLSIGV